MVGAAPAALSADRSGPRYETGGAEGHGADWAAVRSELRASGAGRERQGWGGEGWGGLRGADGATGGDSAHAGRDGRGLGARGAARGGAGCAARMARGTTNREPAPPAAAGW
jgi:hypothetical protein